MINKMKPNFRRDIFLMTRFPEQYEDELNTEEETREISENGGRIIVFPVVLEYNRNQLIQFP